MTRCNRSHPNPEPAARAAGSSSCEPSALAAGSGNAGLASISRTEEPAASAVPLTFSSRHSEGERPNCKFRHSKPATRFFANLQVAFCETHSNLRAAILSIVLLCAFGSQFIGDEPVDVADANAIAPSLEEIEYNRKAQLELAFLKQTVELTPEQERRLVIFDVTKFHRQRKFLPGVELGPAIPTATRSHFDALRLRQFERAFEKEIDAVLDDQQKKEYAFEKKRRLEFSKETSVRGILLLLDQHLTLSKQQCESIRESLSKWSDLDSLDFTPYFTATHCLPPIPDAMIVDHLNEKQRELLRSIPRQNLQKQQQLPALWIDDIRIPARKAPWDTPF